MPSLNSLNSKISARLETGDAVIIGLSGGPDSVFLFHQLRLSPLRLKLTACHVNYHLRGKDSDLDRQFVELLCQKHRIPLEILEAGKLTEKGNLENNCRQLRYRFFEKIRRQKQAKMILVAHQLDDQIETFLLNLTRGSSFRGITAMREYDPDRKLFRPLLDRSKKDILAWLKKHRFKFRLDRSNLSDRFSRNRIRLKILPELAHLNSNFLVTVGQSLNELAEQLDWIDLLADKWLSDNLLKPKPVTSKNPVIGLFRLDIFLLEKPVFQKILLQKMFRNIYKKSLTRHSLAEILTTLRKNRAGLKKEFGQATFLKIIKEGKNGKREVVIEPKLH